MDSFITRNFSVVLLFALFYTLGYLTGTINQKEPETVVVYRQQETVAKVSPETIPQSKPKRVQVTRKATKPKDINHVRIAKAVHKVYKNISISEATEVVSLSYHYANKYKAPPELLIGIVAKESGFRRYAVSGHGAKGYMQVLERVHVDKIKGRDIHDPAVNIEVGTRILGSCIKNRKTLEGAIGCYIGTSNDNKIEAYLSGVNRNKDKIFRQLS